MKLKPFINDSDSKQNENNAVTGWMLTSYVHQNKINKTDNDSDSQTMAIQLTLSDKGFFELQRHGGRGTFWP